MARPVKEWIGKTETSKIPKAVKERIVRLQGDKCKLSGTAFVPGNKPEFDHIKPLRDGGEHRETNLQAISSVLHKAKTKQEAGERAKVTAVRTKHLGITAPKAKIQSPGFARSAKPKPEGKVPLPPRKMFVEIRREI